MMPTTLICLKAAVGRLLALLLIAALFASCTYAAGRSLDDNTPAAVKAQRALILEGRQ